MILFKYIVILIFIVTPVSSQVEGIYCGVQTCYDVLGVSRDASKTEITKAYRTLARKNHPDARPGDKEAHAAFIAIANAYDILRDPEARAEYDYMLDHPEEVYRNYYHYYKRRVAPRVDVRLVIAGVLILISAIQYYGGWYRYNEAISYLAGQGKYRNLAIDIAVQRGLIDRKDAPKKSISKAEVKEYREKVIRDVIAENMDIRGGYRQPKYTDLLLYQIITSPWMLIQWIYFHVSWFWRHAIKKEDYTRDEKLYLIRKYMGLSETKFSAIEEKDIEEMLRRETWIKENCAVYKKEREDESRAQMAKSAKYKQYKRYLKQHGTGRMTFED